MNFDNLPKTWCVDIMVEHPRLKEFKKVFAEFTKTNPNYSFRYYGIDKSGGRNCSNVLRFDFENKDLITINQFFAYIEPLKLEAGNWLYCKGRKPLTKGKLYQLSKSEGIDEPYLYIRRDDNKIYVFHISTKQSESFRNATPEEIAQVQKDEIETRFKRNDTVLVRDSENDEWQERIFIIEYEGLYFCAIETHAGLEPFRFIKPYEKPDALRQLLDDIIEAYAKTGIKLTPHFEKI